MLDAIRSLSELPASSGTHVSREDIAAARGRRDLQQQAQRWARECVDQARREAERLHAQAFHEGYAEGLLRATEHLAKGLLESQSLGRQLRNDLARAAHDLLTENLRRPEWLDEMLERWLAERAGDGNAVMQVMLPMHCRQRGDELRKRLRLIWPGELLVEFHPQERYVVRLGDQLLEFDVETSLQTLEPRLLASLANLPDSVRSLDEASAQALVKLCSSFAGFPESALNGFGHED